MDNSCKYNYYQSYSLEVPVWGLLEVPVWTLLEVSIRGLLEVSVWGLLKRPVHIVLSGLIWMIPVLIARFLLHVSVHPIDEGLVHADPEVPDWTLLTFQAQVSEVSLLTLLADLFASFCRTSLSLTLI